MTLQEAIAKYGEIKDGKWLKETWFMHVIAIPEAIAATWINSIGGQPQRHIYCNQDMAPALLKALQNVLDRGLVSELKTYDGCFQIRPQRGTVNVPSVHSFGMAIDICAKDNVLGCEPTMSPELVACFTDAGFTWGGTFHRKDGMHFQYDCNW